MRAWFRHFRRILGGTKLAKRWAYGILLERRFTGRNTEIRVRCRLTDDLDREACMCRCLRFRWDSMRGVYILYAHKLMQCDMLQIQ